MAAIVAPAHESNIAYVREVGANFYETISDALAREQIDAAVVSSPNTLHLEQTLACIDAGVPTLVEKPITDTLESAATLATRARAAGVPVLVGHHRTYSPLLDTAHAYLHSDAFGGLVSVQGSAQFFKPHDYFEAAPWRKQAGGGPILINLIHDIGLMRYLCGEITQVGVIARNAVRGFEVEDTVAIAMGFDNGAAGTFMLSDSAASSKSWEMTTGENPAFPFYPDEDCYHFAGTVGSLDFPSMRARTYRHRARASWGDAFETEQLAVRRDNPLARQIDHFVAVIGGRERPRVDAWVGYKNMVVLDAIKRSADAGRMVAVEEAEP